MRVSAIAHQLPKIEHYGKKISTLWHIASSMFIDFASQKPYNWSQRLGISWVSAGVAECLQ